MIDTSDLNSNIEIHEKILEVITPLRRGHVSKFPIRMVVQNKVRVAFVDPRFPDYDSVAVLAYGPDNKGRIVFCIDSPFITNDKYSIHSHGYHQKVTQDPKAALKTLKEVVRPYAAPDIAQRSVHDALRQRTAWVNEAKWDTQAYFSIDSSAIFSEVHHMIASGYTPRTQGFVDAMTKGVEAHQEMKRREDIQSVMYHVLLNPNGVVIVTKQRPNGKDLPESETYQSLDECPAFVQQQVSLLKLVETTHNYVPEVGIKMSPIEYWVERMENQNT